MISPIGPQQPLFPQGPGEPNAPEISKELQKHLDDFSQKLHHIHNDSTLATDPEFQRQFATTVRQLHQVVEKAMQLW